MKKLLQDRKTLYLVLAIVVVSVFTLSIAYAAMSAVLEIHGNSEVIASSWDIHLENAERLSECNIGSATGPSISMDGTSILFDVELSEPGECFGFTVDVVNDGTIDAMIDSVVKTPELTSEQAKYIRYEVTYENGESISTKQTLKKGTSTPVKVKLEYRKDISVSDLPSSNTSLSLRLMFVYVQSDGSGSSIPNNGVDKVVNVVSGDGTQVGNEVCIKEECFYVISSTDSTVTMLAKYNLHVGNSYDGSNLTPLSSPTGIQDEDAKGYYSDSDEHIGVTAFASASVKGGYYSDYIGSIVEGYVDSYSLYLSGVGITPLEARLITYDELKKIGCDDHYCNSAPSWVYSISYWTGTKFDDEFIYYVNFNVFTAGPYNYDNGAGVRPVITISRDYL